MQKTIFICEDTIESILTGVYDAYASKLGHDNCKLAVGEAYELFCDYRQVISSKEKAAKVTRTLQRRFGQERYYDILLILCSYQEDKADVVYHMIVTGLDKDLGYRLLDHLSDSNIARAFTIRRNVANELMHIREFLRFEELSGGLMVAKVKPQNNILPFLMPHFSDRFPLENFVIYDENRMLAGLHQKKTPWYLAQTDGLDSSMMDNITEEEKYYGELFKMFCKTITIESRKNADLQRQLLPLKFRGNMVEFQ